MKNRIKRVFGSKNYKNNYELVLQDFKKIFYKHVELSRSSLNYLENHTVLGWFTDEAKEKYLEKAKLKFEKKVNKFFNKLIKQDVSTDFFKNLIQDIFFLEHGEEINLSNKSKSDVENIDILLQMFLMDFLNLASQTILSAREIEQSEIVKKSNFNLAWDEIEQSVSVKKYFDYRKKLFESDSPAKTIEEKKEESLEEFKGSLDACQEKLLGIPLKKEEVLKLKVSFLEIMKTIAFDGEFDNFLLQISLSEAKKANEILEKKKGFVEKMFKSIVLKQNKALDLFLSHSTFVTLDKNNNLFLNFPSPNGTNVREKGENCYSFGREITERIIESSGNSYSALYKIAAKHGKQI